MIVSSSLEKHFLLAARFEVFTAVKIQVAVFWVVKLSNVVVEDICSLSLCYIVKTGST